MCDSDNDDNVWNCYFSVMFSQVMPMLRLDSLLFQEGELTDMLKGLSYHAVPSMTRGGFLFLYLAAQKVTRSKCDCYVNLICNTALLLKIFSSRSERIISNLLMSSYKSDFSLCILSNQHCITRDHTIPGLLQICGT